MVRRTLLLLGFVVLAAFAWVGADRASAEEADVASDVDALLSTLRAADSFVPAGESPTARLVRLLGRPKRLFLKELSTRWEDARKEERRDPALERLILFVHGKADDTTAISLIEGVVRIGIAPQGDFDFGSFDAPKKPEIPSFRALVAKGRVLRAPKPNLGALLDLAEAGFPDAWSAVETATVAMAIGESSASSETACERLADAAGKRPTDAALTTALAWSRSGLAKDVLRKRVRELAARVSDGREAALPLLRSAVQGLDHVSPEALVRLLGDLDEKVQSAVISATSLRVGLPVALQIGASSDEDAQAHGARLLRTLFADWGRHEATPAEHVPELIRQLRRNLDTPALVDLTGQTAEWALYAHARYPVDSSSSSGGSSFEEQGQRVGPYPNIYTVLRALADDLEARRVRFLPEDQGAFLADQGGWGMDLAAPRTAVECPEPNRAGHEELPLRLTARVEGSELALSLTNEGKTSLWINTVALKYGTAEWTTCTVDRKRSYTNLYIELGFLRVRTAATAKSLSELPPGGSYAWSLRIRDEHAGADHISIELIPFIGATARPKGKLVEAFPEVWIR